MALLFCSILGIVSISVTKPLSLPTTDQSLAPTTQSLSLIPLSSNNSITSINSTIDLSAPHTLCSEQSEGFDLVGDQCKEALVNSDFARLPPNEMLTFQSRSLPPLAGNIGLPRRYHSSDGKCVIEPSLPLGVIRAHGTARTFNEAANRLIYKCVDHSTHTGGTTYNIGADNNLEVKVSGFNPKVRCYGSVNRQNMVPSCNNFADRMDASAAIIPFTSSQSWNPKAALLPHSEVDPAGGGCRLTVSFQNDEGEPLQFSSWYAVWQAMLAINAMCIRNGQRGKWLSLGYSIKEPGIIDVDVSEAQAEQQTPITATA